MRRTTKTLAADLLKEMAELTLDNIRQNASPKVQQIVEKGEQRVGGEPGFRIIYTYPTQRRLKIKGVLYGAMQGDSLYYLLYEAPERYYFDKDLPVFEKVKESFKFLKSS